MTTSADEGSIAEVGSPIVVPADPVDEAAPWRWATRVIVAAAAVLALLNAHAVGAWFDELTPGPATEPLRAPVGYWTGTAEARGLDAPRAALRRGWERIRNARFGSEGADAQR